MRIDLAYDGTDFHGWATQPNVRTVQGELESALATILRLESPPSVTCAGRTDTGVHARGQVAHVDLDTHPGVLERRLRRLVPDDIRIKSVTEAHPDFDARFAAIERRYVYRMTDHPAGPDPLSRRMITALHHPLDVDAMNAAGRHLVGEHDFAAFCKKREGATTIRAVKDIRTVRGGETIATTIRADAFCHSMVRSIIGCLVAVGERKFGPEFAAEILAAKVRDPRVKVMAAGGLVLEEVVYPPDEELATRIEQSRQLRA